MYRFFDREGQTLALRADFTPQMARMAATKLFDQPMPLRCSYVGSLFRYEEPQAGRKREFTQTGVELIGADTPAADAEVVALSIAALEALSLREFQVNLGQMTFFHALTAGLPEESLNPIRDAIDHKNHARLAEVLGQVALSQDQRNLLERLPVEVCQHLSQLLVHDRAVCQHQVLVARMKPDQRGLVRLPALQRLPARVHVYPGNKVIAQVRIVEAALFLDRQQRVGGHDFLCEQAGGDTLGHPLVVVQLDALHATAGRILLEDIATDVVQILAGRAPRRKAPVRRDRRASRVPVAAVSATSSTFLMYASVSSWILVCPRL